LFITAIIVVKKMDLRLEENIGVYNGGGRVGVAVLWTFFIGLSSGNVVLQKDIIGDL